MELLSPVGNIGMFNAALANGADAVYLGLKLFNARRLAGNFTIDELKELIFQAHIRKVKVYLTLNTLVRNNEIEKWFETIKKVYELGVDAIIIQEITLSLLLRKFFSDLEIHASTQSTIMNSNSINLFPDLDLIVLARELTKEQIKHLDKKNKKIEIFVHGHQCISVSGQCLISSLIGSRSGNRGVCASSCRKKYNNSGYLISAKDLNLSNQLKGVEDSGVDSIKIEGRMKSPEYVASTTRIYRKQIDLLKCGKEKKVSKKEEDQLKLSFNRDFSEGFFSGSKSIVGKKMPMNRGVSLGVINKGKLILKHSLSLSDGVSFWDGEKFTGMQVEQIFIDKKRIEKANMDEEISLNHYSFRNGVEVFLTSSGLNKLNLIPSKPLMKLKVFGKIGKRLKFEDWNIESESNLQEAKNSVLSKEKFLDFFKTFPFNLVVEWNVEEGFLPNSHGVQMRKDLEEELRRKMSINRIGKVELPEVEEFKGEKGLYVKVYNLEGIKEASKADVVYYDVFNKDVLEAKKLCKTNLFLDTPVLMTDKDMEKAQKIIDKVKPDGLMVGNWGVLGLKFKGKLHGKYSLNIFNDLSAEWLRKKKVIPMISIELSFSQLKQLKNKDFIYYAHGRIPVMHLKGMYEEKGLKDEKNYLFPLRINNGNTEMLHSRPFAVLDKIKELQKVGIGRFFLDLEDDVEKIVGVYLKLIEGKKIDVSLLKKGTTLKPFNIGVG